MAWAASTAWVCDDAFITFRYAENVANGLGAVFNAGQRVEGYSNPSWMLLCALAVELGLDPVTVGQWLGIFCYGALVPVTWWTGQRLVPDAPAFLPLAAIAVALHQHLRDFSSCGLETLGFVLLVTLVAGVLARAERPRSFAIASLLTVLAALTRPDGALVGALAGLIAVVASVRSKSLGPALAFALPGFLLFVPFLAWRYLYFGDLLPNTFYAKSAHDPYASQGWFYVQLYLSAYWVLWPAILATLIVPRMAFITLGYLVFVVWVGGDFMFARFCLPVTPLLYLALEVAVRRWLPIAAGWVAVAVVAGATLMFHERPDLYVEGQAVQGVADERAQYPDERTTAIRAAGRRFGELTAGTGVRVAFSGTQAMFVYEAKVPYALEAVTGLTDRFLARGEIGERGHIGHEKGMFRSAETIEYGLRTQEVHLLLFDYPDWTGAFPFLEVEFEGFTFTLVRWDPEVMSSLIGQPNVVVTDLDRFLDTYIAALDQKPKARVQADLEALDRFYFRWNDDAVRRAKIVARLQ